MSRRVVITGASGLLGRALRARLEGSPGWVVLGLALSRARGGLRACDITDRAQVAQVIREFKPALVVHCAAERRPDVVEHQQESTYAVNVTATKHLAEEAGLVGAVVVYISTDYVFDGSSPPYSVDDKPCPINKYGASKLEGETAVMETSKGNMVLRLPLLYGAVERLDESAVTVLFKPILDTSHDCHMSHHERRFPTRVDDVAAVLRDLMDKRLQDPSLCGIFHWSGDENMTKYDMAMTMAELFHMPTRHIRADTCPTQGTRRPYDAHLDSSRMQRLGICHRTPFRDGIKPYLEPFFHQKND